MRFLPLTLALACFILRAQTNPAPLIDSPLPNFRATPGSGPFTLTIYGTGFAAGSVVNWNGSPRATALHSQSELTASILSADVARAGSVAVTVVNPQPAGTSNTVYFQVGQPLLKPNFSYLLSPGANNPYIVAVAADLNRDGKLDLLGPNYVALGNGDGTFQQPVFFSACATPNCQAFALAAGDLNRDGHTDLAGIANGSVTVLLGNGDGTFATFQSYATDPQPASLAIGDFNRDGNLDLAVVCQNAQLSQTVVLDVLLGNGDGTFQPAIRYPISVAVPLSQPLVGDFNGDGYLDLAAPFPGGIGLLFGHGDGSFGSVQTIRVRNAGPFAVAADVNGDGKLDLALEGRNEIDVLLGNGDGTFAAPVRSTVPGGHGVLLAGDFTGDGKVDLAVITRRLTILAGKGDGTFQLSSQTRLPDEFLSVAGDFNNDGLLDLAGVTANGDLTAYLQTAEALSTAHAFLPPVLLGQSGSPRRITVTNEGTVPLNVGQLDLSGTDAADFSIVHNTCAGTAVPSAASCTFGVTLTPSAQGFRSASVSIPSNAAASPQAVIVSGIGATLKLAPRHRDFGRLQVRTISPAQKVKVTNTGTNAAEMFPMFAGEDAGDFHETNHCKLPLPPGASCILMVQFIPTKVGPRKAQLFIYDNPEGTNSTYVAVSGTGVARK